MLDESIEDIRYDSYTLTDWVKHGIGGISGTVVVAGGSYRLSEAQFTRVD